MSENVIKIKNLTKEFTLGKFNTKHFFNKITQKQSQNKIALNNINLDIKKGEKIGIVGKNGSGKSTLLKIICRITYPTNGVIEVKGKVTSILEAAAGFHKELNCYENIYLNGSILGMRRNEIKHKIENIINFSGLSYKNLHTPLKRFSSGELIRLGFSIIMHLDSEILILDEMLAVSDKDFERKSISLINSKIKDENKTLIFVSHQLHQIKEWCNRCILIDRGKVIADDSTNNILDYYEKLNSK